eukprot:13506183-Ditylum_brightwellii.AAC.1
MCVGQSERETDTETEKFYVTMGNYFTLPHVIKHLRKKGIGVVGTTRMRKGWPHPGILSMNMELWMLNGWTIV